MMIDISSVYIYCQPLVISTAWVKSLCRTRELLFHSSQLKPDVSQHKPGFFDLPFPYTGSWISPIKISCHFTVTELCRVGLSVAKLWLPLGHTAPGKVAYGGGQHCPAQCAPRDTLHSSARRSQGMEHTQSYSFLLLGAFGLCPPSSPLSDHHGQALPNQVLPSVEMAKLI